MRRQKRVEAAHLSHKDVVQAALHIIDHDGLAGLSMRKLGMHLGVDPMAIYYYFPNKQAILDAIMEAVMSQIKIPDTLISVPSSGSRKDIDSRRLPTGKGYTPNPKESSGNVLGSSWVEDLRTLLREFRRVLRAHRHALPVVTSHPMRTPAGLQLTEAVLRLLRSAGFSPQEAVDAVVNLGHFVMGHVLTEGKETYVNEASLAQTEIQVSVSQLSSYPCLQEVLQSGITYNPDQQFEHGLDLFLLGLQAQREKLTE
jgi:TetR/AcrR family tetracycline transcriptional repressor